MGPEKGGGKPYRLLADAMAQRQRVAVAQYVTRGKGYLALIRPFQDGMILHTLYFADEFRNFDEIEKPTSAKPTEQEVEMGMDVVEQESNDKLGLEKYHDEHRLPVLKLVDVKVKGQGVEVARAPEPRGQVVDLMEALKRSLAKDTSKQELKPERPPEWTTRKILTLADFKSVFNQEELEIPEQSIRKSYQGLDKLRKRKELSWAEVREKVHELATALQVELLKERQGNLRAIRIPLTDRDWERLG